MRTSFLTSADGTRLRIAQWGEGPRDVLMVHGLAEHAGRYEALGEALAAAGFTATLLELRGHGHSGGKRGYVARWSEYVDDVRAAVATLRPGWSLFAHSMGGLVALDAVLAGVAPSRLALTSPLLGVALKLPGWKVGAAGVLSKLWPSFAMVNEIDPSALSRDQAVGLAYMADPLVFKTGTPRWYTEMNLARERVLAAPAWTVPMAMWVGSDDHVTDPVVNQAFASRFHAQLTVLPEWRHEILNELGKEEATAAIVAWLT